MQGWEEEMRETLGNNHSLSLSLSLSPPPPPSSPFKSKKLRGTIVPLVDAQFRPKGETEFRIQTLG
jgi:hypothetical protein